MSIDVVYVIGGGTISPNYSYHVKFSATDAFGTVERIVDVSTSEYTMFFRKGGTGVAFGKASEKEYAVEIAPNWDLYMGETNVTQIISSIASQGIPNIVYSAAQPTGTLGMIWLKPKG